MNQFTNRQVIVLCMLSMGSGALFFPTLKSVAQPTESQPEGSAAPSAATPQPLSVTSAPTSEPTPAYASATRTASAIGTITGQGTTGYIPKFTGPNAIGDSILFESAGKIGIGTTSPLSPFSVTGVGSNNYVIFGYNSGTGNAILGKSLSGIGVHGIHTNTSDPAGVQGETTSTSANATGVQGISQSSAPGANSAGVRGINNGTGATGYGIYGMQNGGGIAVYGTTPSGFGVAGDSKSGIGMRGRHILGTGAASGVQGETNSTDDNATGVQGIINPTSPGVFSAGVRGINNGTSANGIGVYGSHQGGGVGVYGSSPDGKGVLGGSSIGTGVSGSSSTSVGVSGSSNTGSGVTGTSFSNAAITGDFHNLDASSTQKGTALRGLSAAGSSALLHPNGAFYSAAGEFSGPNGVIGAASYSNGYGVIGVAPSSGNGYGLYSSGNAYVSGKLTVASNTNIIGNLSVTGTLSKGAGSFKIDHPLHPATEYLSHSFVESPDMMNVYNGNITTNGKGEAVVTLPDYFQSLNRDFRYQLTCIGAPALVYVAHEIQGNHFTIAGGKAGMKVSWQVTGIRNDAYARQNRIRVEENKMGDERGKYLYPAGFGFGKDKQIGAASIRLAKR